MGNIEKTAKDRRGLLAWALGVLLLALSARIATTGLFWSSNYHPDETKIIRWVKQVRDNGYIRDRAYPSGWFEMYRAVFWLEDRAGKIRQLLREGLPARGNGAVMGEKGSEIAPVFFPQRVKIAVFRRHRAAE